MRLVAGPLRAVARTADILQNSQRVPGLGLCGRAGHDDVIAYFQGVDGHRSMYGENYLWMRLQPNLRPATLRCRPSNLLLEG